MSGVIPAQIKEEPGRRRIENQRPVRPQVVGSVVKPSNVGNDLISLPLTNFISRDFRLFIIKHEYLAAYHSSGWMIWNLSSGWDVPVERAVCGRNVGEEPFRVRACPWVCLAEVGAIFGLETSWWAWGRGGYLWHHVGPGCEESFND